MSVTDISEEALIHLSCIHYLVRFRKDKDAMQALINSGSEVNDMLPTYTKKLGLEIRKTDVGALKIDGSTFSIFGIVIAGFEV